jgi:hypothetical protein
MKYIISKDQYRRVLLKFLDSFIKGFIVDSFEDEKTYRYVKTSNGDEFATLWDGGPITIGCNRDLSLDNDFTNDFENFTYHHSYPYYFGIDNIIYGVFIMQSEDWWILFFVTYLVLTFIVCGISIYFDYIYHGSNGWSGLNGGMVSTIIRW